MDNCSNEGSLDLESFKPDSATNHYPRGRQLFMVAFSVSMLVVISGLEVTITAAIGPSIAMELKDTALAPYLGSAYLLSAAVSAPIYARASDCIGRAPVVLFSGLLLMVGLSLCSMASNMPFLLVARGISGLGSGGINIMSSILLSENVPLRSRAFWYAIGKVIAGVSAALGGPVGGLLTDGASWRVAFGAQVPFCVAAVITASACLTWRANSISSIGTQHFPKQQLIHNLDFFGSAMLTCTIIPTLFIANSISYLIRTSFSWNNYTPTTIALLITIISGYTLRRVETHAAKPIIDFVILRDRTVFYTCVLNFAGSFTHHAVLYSLPFYVVVVDHRSATQAGLYLLPVAFSASLGSLLVGLLVAKHGRYYAFLVLGTCLVTGGPISLMCMASTDSSKIRDVLKYLSIFPASSGAQIISSISMVSVLAVRGDKDLAACTGLLSLSKSLGGVFGSAASASLIQFYISLISSCSNAQFDTEIVGVSSVDLIPELATTELMSRVDTCWARSFMYTFATLLVVSACFLLAVMGINEVNITDKGDLVDSQ